MRYADARSQIQSGDLLAWRGETALGRLVRMATGGSWSHVGVAWHFRGRLFVLEAREGAGVQLRAASNALPFDWIATGNLWGAPSEALALALLGRPYSYGDFVQAGLGLRLTDKRGFICSEYAAFVLGAGDPSREAYPVAPTPAALVDHFLDSGAPLSTVRP